MIALAAFIIFLIIALSRGELCEEQIRLDTPGICRGCTYDLTGLTEGSLCPECGLSSAPHYKQIQWTESRLERPMLIHALIGLAILIAYYASIDFLASYIAGISYWASGYHWTTARTAALSWGSHTVFDVRLFPLNVAVASWPIFARYAAPRYKLLSWVCTLLVAASLAALLNLH